jgi:hypothetical protein
MTKAWSNGLAESMPAKKAGPLPPTSSLLKTGRPPVDSTIWSVPGNSAANHRWGVVKVRLMPPQPITAHPSGDEYPWMAALSPPNRTPISAY